MNTRKYLTLTRAGMIEALQFKGAIFSIIIGNLVYLIMIYFLWKAIFASVDTTTVNGMTFEDTMIYLVLASALFYFMEMYLVWEMGRDIQSGKIILDIIKPMKYPIFKFFQLSGNFIMFFFITFLPTFIVVYIVTYGAIHLDYNILFLVSVLLGLLINYFIDFLLVLFVFILSQFGNKYYERSNSAAFIRGNNPYSIFPGALKNSRLLFTLSGNL